MGTIGGGRYELGAPIASGAIGVVVRAVDTGTGEPVAVKRLRPETAGHPESVLGFLAEAEILAQLRHPAIVRLRDLLSEPGHSRTDLSTQVDGALRAPSSAPREADVARSTVPGSSDSRRSVPPSGAAATSTQSRLASSPEKLDFCHMGSDTCTSLRIEAARLHPV